MIIKNGLVFEETGKFQKRNLFINSAHKITEEPVEGDSHVINAEGLYVIPGLVDVHIHGALGWDLCDQDGEGLCKIAAYLKSRGITTFCPASMTLPIEKLEKIFQTVSDVPETSDYASLAGIHMEGPFISPQKKGAQKEDYILSPDIDIFKRLNESCGNKIRIVTIAPELPQAMEFIRTFSDKLSVSLGHSAADYDTACLAYKAGANHVTHLFNAMPPLNHREPGIIGAAADSPHVMAELICDGLHVSPSVIRMAFSVFGDDRIVLISDAMRATGMEDGTYELGGQPVLKKGNRAVLKDGTLAGSVTNLMECMKNAVSFGIPLESAVKAATINPARSIGSSSVGNLSPGREGDVLLLDKNLDLVQVI